METYTEPVPVQRPTQPPQPSRGHLHPRHPARLPHALRLRPPRQPKYLVPPGRLHHPPQHLHRPVLAVRSRKIRQLSRLETVDYSLDKIVSGERGNPYIPDFLIGDKLLLIAHGEVIAGVDLSQLKPGDVTVSGNSVRVRLPQPQILTTRIDNSRTRIYSRTTGLLVAPDPTSSRRCARPPSSRSGRLLWTTASSTRPARTHASA